MKKITANKIIIIFSIILILGIYLINQNYLRSKFLNKPLPEVKLKEKIKKEKTFAIMISEDGNNYQKYDSNEWPNDDYYFKKSECVNNNSEKIENILTFDEKNNEVTLKTDQTVYCTLFFDKYNYMKVPLENTGNVFSGSAEIISSYMLPEIKNIYFVNYINLNNAIEHWNIGDTNSGTKTDAVVAWTETLKNNSNYKNLFIGSNNIIRAKSLERAFVGTERDSGGVPVRNINLETIDFNNMLDTSKTTTFDSMFYCDQYLKSIKGMDRWDVSNVKTTRLMFYYDKSLSDLTDIANWNISSMTSLRWMFQTCTSLKNLDLSGWSSSSLIDMDGVFSGCENLSIIDMRNIIFSNLSNYGSTFSRVGSSATIIVKDEVQREWLKSKNLFPGTIKLPIEI